LKPFLAAVAIAIGLAGPLSAAEVPAPAGSAEHALAKLMIGNRRYITNHMQHPNQTRAARQALTEAQHPFATVLSCADSRVPPEIIFDGGLGDFFVVRVAGNIADDAILGSLEYSAGHLHVPLIVVLGHTRCGAVTAAVQGFTEHNHVNALIKALQPAVAQAAREPGDKLTNAIRDNVLLVVRQLQASHPVLAELQAKGKLRIVGAIYDLDTGRVDFLK
jgi:carbonic anhydrase